jgi:hypothetical protein
MLADDSSIRIEEPRTPPERLAGFAAEAADLDGIRATYKDVRVSVTVVDVDDSLSTGLSALFAAASRYALTPETGHFGTDAVQIEFVPVEHV